jgi:hypothetical protein
VQLNPRLFRLFDSYSASQRAFAAPRFRMPSMRLKKLARLAGLFHMPDGHIDEIRAMYNDMMEDETRLREHLHDLNAFPASVEDPPIKCYISSDYEPSDLGNRHAHALRVIYSVLLTMTSALNSFLQALEPGNQVIRWQRTVIVDHAIAMAQQGLQYRPLGASYVPCNLVAMVSPVPAVTSLPVSCFLR